MEWTQVRSIFYHFLSFQKPNMLVSPGSADVANPCQFCQFFGSLSRLHNPQFAVDEVGNVVVVWELLEKPRLDIGVTSARTLYLLEQVKQFVSILVGADVLLHALIGQSLGGIGNLGGAVGFANNPQIGERRCVFV